MAKRRRRGYSADPIEHPITCGCRACMTELRLQLGRTDQLELEDLDSMEDDHLPYIWNRRD